MTNRQLLELQAALLDELKDYSQVDVSIDHKPVSHAILRVDGLECRLMGRVTHEEARSMARSFVVTARLDSNRH